MPNDAWRKLMREEVIKCILNPMGDSMMQQRPGGGGGQVQRPGGVGGQVGFDMDMGGAGMRSFMDGANAFNDMHQGNQSFIIILSHTRYQGI